MTCKDCLIFVQLVYLKRTHQHIIIRFSKASTDEVYEKKEKTNERKKKIKWRNVET